MKIHELCVRTGLPRHTIRFYEKIGLLDGRFVERLENNYRTYTEDAVERIAMIRRAQTAGFSLAEIGSLMSAWDAGELTAADQIVHIGHKIEEISRTIAELTRVKAYLTEKIVTIRSGMDVV